MIELSISILNPQHYNSYIIMSIVYMHYHSKASIIEDKILAFTASY